MSERATLVGVATGTPDGGVAIVRISGPRAQAIAQAVVGALPPARRLARRAIALGGGEHEDGLVVAMPGPGSMTGDDVVELHVHAGERNVARVVDAILRGGAVAAGPGDFTRRAFELGRLGLDEAEGIAAIIGARTDAALAQARRLAGGGLGRQVEALRQQVVELRAEVEANLDFPEDVEAAAIHRWGAELSALCDAVRDWLSRFEAGRRARLRPRIVLAGPVNAGKSSLFNALLGRTRAIVSDVPGTTRDFIEAELDLGAYGATLVDTAGRREGGDAIEREGIALGGAQVEDADVIVWIEAADASEVVIVPDGATVLHVESKRDLGARRAAWIGVSTAGEPGVEPLRAALLGWFRAGVDEPWIGLARHRQCAAQALDALDEAARLLTGSDAMELGAFALGVADARLGEITGRSTTGPIGAEVLDAIFSRFCIGK